MEDKLNGSILIDLENLRISWQTVYRTVFGYRDLCVFVNELESTFQFNCISIQIYATNLHWHSTKMRDKIAELSSYEIGVDAMTRLKYALEMDIYEYKNLLLKLQADTHATSVMRMDDFEKRRPASPSYPDLTSPTGRRCKVEVHCFGMKQSGKRQVQRGADCSLSGDLVHATYNKNFDLIFCVSGDSDFVNVLEDCYQRAKERTVFYMLSHVMNFSAFRDVKLVFLSETNRSKWHCNGVNYISIERALPRLVTYDKSLSNPSSWTKRTPIPMFYYPNDVAIRQQWGDNFTAAEKRFEYLVKKGKIKKLVKAVKKTAPERSEKKITVPVPSSSIKRPLPMIDLSDDGDVDPVLSYNSDTTKNNNNMNVLEYEQDIMKHFAQGDGGEFGSLSIEISDDNVDMDVSSPSTTLINLGPNSNEPKIVQMDIISSSGDKDPLMVGKREEPGVTQFRPKPLDEATVKSVVNNPLNNMESMSSSDVEGPPNIGTGTGISSNKNIAEYIDVDSIYEAEDKIDSLSLSSDSIILLDY